MPGKKKTFEQLKIEAKIVARKVVKFKPSLIFKKKINNNE